jgi:hypothetical protein
MQKKMPESIRNKNKIKLRRSNKLYKLIVVLVIYES